MNRQDINRIIIKAISDCNEQHSDLRFQQILSILDISKSKPEYINGNPTGNMIGEDLFHEESLNTLKRIEDLNNKQLI